MYIKPVYIVGRGNCTEVLTVLGRYEYGERIETICGKIFKEFAIDRKAQKKNIKKKYFDDNKRHNLLPVILEDKFVYVCVKLREKTINNDSAYGLIEVDRISKVDDGDETSIVLSDGKAIRCYCDSTNVACKIQKAKRIKYDLIKN
ncbi:MAG: hypothetical protein GXZ08_10070 [Tissierellia bacterium]|nr:hypothetical protein [Tissierellia bacterium]